MTNGTIRYEAVKVTGKQKLLLDCDDVDYVYYGGAKGGGKSFAVVLKFVYKLIGEEIWEYIDNPKDKTTTIRKCKGIKQTTHRKFYGIIIRQNNYELEELKKICREILPRFGGKLKTQTPYVWIFPHLGEEIKLTLVQVEKDLSKVQGQQYDFVAVDEICNYENPYDFISTLRSCMRGSHKVGGKDRKNIRQLVLTGNPVGAGALEIQQMFVDPYPIGGKKLFVKTPFGQQTGLSFRFIRALLTDNKYILENDPEYIQSLFALRHDLTMAYVFGELDNSVGVYFDSFQPKHILKRKEDDTLTITKFIEEHSYTEDWVRVAGMDWGVKNPYCVLFGVRVTRPVGQFKKDDIIIYKELYGKDPAQKTGGTGESIHEVVDKLKDMMTAREREMSIYIDTQMWNPTGFGNDESITFQLQRDMYDDITQEQAEYQNEMQRLMAMENNEQNSVGRAFKARMNDGVYKNVIKAANKAIASSCLYIHGLFKDDKIWIMDNCPNLIRQLQSIKIDENNHQKPMKKSSVEDHAVDAFRYLIAAQEMANIQIRARLTPTSLMPNQCKY